MAYEHPEYVTQDQCEERRNQMALHFENVTKDISKLYGIEKAQAEQIKTIFSVCKWLGGVSASILAAVILLIIKGALGI